MCLTDGFFVGNGNIGDDGVARADSAEFDDLVDRVGAALGVNFERPVGPVAHPAANTAASCGVSHTGSEEHALDTSADYHAASHESGVVHQITAPTIDPIPYVTAAAAAPIVSWRTAPYTAF